MKSRWPNRSTNQLQSQWPNPTGSDLSLDAEEMVAGPASDLSLDDVDEPTVAGLDDGSDDALALDDDGSIDINTDSILLSENRTRRLDGPAAQHDHRQGRPRSRRRPRPLAARQGRQAL